MDMYARTQYLQSVQAEYLAALKHRKRELLDEAVKRTGLNRKYLIRRLAARTRWRRHPVVRGYRPRIYGLDLRVPLVRLWDIFGNPCGARLQPLLKTEVARLRTFGELILTNDQAVQLQAMSPRTIDRLLTHEKEVRHLHRQTSGQTHPLLYQLIRTKMSDEFDRTTAGQIQLDAVEHCGATTQGEYATTVSAVDVASYWRELQAILGKGQQRTITALDQNRRQTPFPWIEAHPDNGTSFLNWHLWGYAQHTKLKLSRSRSYQKNDNCWVEQTNGDAVRRYVGHVRYDTEEEVVLLNELYAHLRQFLNFFQPVMRLETKSRTNGHISRRYQKAKTPYQWLMNCPTISPDIKNRLQTEYQIINPAELKRQIDASLARLVKTYAAKHGRTTDPVLPAVTFSFDATTLVRLPTHVT